MAKVRTKLQETLTTEKIEEVFSDKDIEQTNVVVPEDIGNYQVEVESIPEPIRPPVNPNAVGVRPLPYLNEVKPEVVPIMPDKLVVKKSEPSSINYSRRNIENLHQTDSEIGVPTNIESHGVYKLRPDRPIKN